MLKNSYFKSGILLLAFTLVLPLAACKRQAPLRNWVDMPVVGAKNGPVAKEKVKEVILEACKNRGWAAREVSPGLIRAELNARQKHSATIEIPYSGASYSIIYKDSFNLRYNPATQTIHNQYNNWVINLRRDIDIRLAQK